MSKCITRLFVPRARYATSAVAARQDHRPAKSPPFRFNQRPRNVLLDLVQPIPLQIPYKSSLEREVKPAKLQELTRGAAKELVGATEVLSALARAIGADAKEVIALAKRWLDKWKGSMSNERLGSFERQRAAYAEETRTALIRTSLTAFMHHLADDSPYSIEAQRLLDAVDLTRPEKEYAGARAMKRHFIMHVGPTNSGKTYSALVALARARRGVYAGPLRLLAHEIAYRFNNGQIGGLEGVGRKCNLITGEEQRLEDGNAGLTASTVEMISTSALYDVAVVDEIQLIGDTARGAAWTRAVLGLRAKEIHLCGEASSVELISKIVARTGDSIEVRRYERLNGLELEKEALDTDIEQWIQPGDCIIAFSRKTIFSIKSLLEQRTSLKVACCYGALPPEVRDEQARSFNDGTLDVMVASDAIGMGLNLKIRRVIFETSRKFQRYGRDLTALSVPSIKQIAGRAGRYQAKAPLSPSLPDIDTTPDTTSPGIVASIYPEDHVNIKQAFACPPVELLYASLAPDYEMLRRLRNACSESAVYADLVALSLLLGHADEPYRVTAGAQVGHSAGAISEIRGLTLAEMDFFSCAPTDDRSEEGRQALVHFATSKRDGKAVDITEYARKTGIRALIRAAASSKNLQKLEAANKVLVLYRWLSYRDPLIFREGSEAIFLSQEVNDALSKSLAASQVPQLRRRSPAAVELEVA